jgi:hypothetical protein
MSADPTARVEAILTALRANWQELRPGFWETTYQPEGYAITIQTSRTTGGYYEGHFDVLLAQAREAISPTSSGASVQTRAAAMMGTGNAGDTAEEAQRCLEKEITLDLVRLLERGVIQ